MTDRKGKRYSVVAGIGAGYLALKYSGEDCLDGTFALNEKVTLSKRNLQTSTHSYTREFSGYIILPEEFL